MIAQGGKGGLLPQFIYEGYLIGWNAYLYIFWLVSFCVGDSSSRYRLFCRLAVGGKPDPTYGKAPGGRTQDHTQ